MAYGAYNLVGNVFHDSAVAHHFGQSAFPDTEKFIRPENDQGNHFLWNVLDRVVQRKVVFAGNGADDVEFLCLADLAERHDSSVGD